MKRGWEYGFLEDAVNKGTSNISLKKINDDEGDYPVYSAKGYVKNISFFQQEQEYLAIIKDGAGIGRISKHPAKSSIVATMQYLIPKEGFDIGFIEYFLIGIDFEKYRKGSTIPHIYFKNYKSEPFPLLPLPEQKRIVAILDKAFTAIDKAKANAEQNLKNAKELFESYLQGVFEDKGEGWVEKPLREVAKTNGRIGWKGLTAKEYTEEGPLFLSVHSLNYGDYVDFRQAFHISQERYDESPEIMLKKDDILICKDGAGIGKLGIVPKLQDFTTINSSLLLIRCKKDILTKYLYYNLLSPVFQSIVQSRLSGATTPHLYQRDIVTFPILLPSLTEQQTIVKKLDALSAETNKLEAIYQQKADNLEELKKSVLQKAFNGELTSVDRKVP